MFREHDFPLTPISMHQLLLNMFRPRSLLAFGAYSCRFPLQLRRLHPSRACLVTFTKTHQQRSKKKQPWMKTFRKFLKTLVERLDSNYSGY